MLITSQLNFLANHSTLLFFEEGLREEGKGDIVPCTCLTDETSALCGSRRKEGLLTGDCTDHWIYTCNSIENTPAQLKQKCQPNSCKKNANIAIDSCVTRSDIFKP
jgi:hypothetical protein